MLLRAVCVTSIHEEASGILLSLYWSRCDRLVDKRSDLIAITGSSDALDIFF